jgi:VWFA-related protein
MKVRRTTHSLVANQLLLRVVAFLGLAIASGSHFANAQTKIDTTPAPADQPSFHLSVKSNLVVVRVVVRDAQGKPVEGLKKEDFKLLDRGKEQSIAQFEEEFSTPPATSAAPGTAPQKESAPASFLALYFDDLNTSDGDMMQAREAADRFLASNLHPNDRVAIFTSGKMLSDFTADPRQIHDALSKLHTSPRALTRLGECPDLSDYQAEQIEKNEDDQQIDAWKMALDEMAHNPQCPQVPNPVPFVQMQARTVLAQAQIQSRSNLQVLERVVAYTSRMPGRRTVILVSPGFLSESEQYQLDHIIDEALRSQVVISSLDPKGLALMMRETDVTRSYQATAASGVTGATHNIDWARQAVAGDVLAEVARGTGGEFFNNNNDLKAGFSALAGSPMYYILAFSPTDAKADGRFHALKVTLSEKAKGITIQARRGYFAPKNEAEAAADAKLQAVSEAEAQAEEQIREAVVSKTDTAQLPVALTAKLADIKGDRRELSLMAHLDATPLHFHREGDHNLNTVTFIFAIFDQKENLVQSQRRRARVDVLDAQLPDLFKSGVDADMTFSLKPGIYRIREVVADSEEHRMATFTRNVQIP